MGNNQSGQLFGIKRPCLPTDPDTHILHVGCFATSGTKNVNHQASTHRGSRFSCEVGRSGIWHQAPRSTGLLVYDANTCHSSHSGRADNDYLTLTSGQRCRTGTP